MFIYVFFNEGKECQNNQPDCVWWTMFNPGNGEETRCFLLDSCVASEDPIAFTGYRDCPEGTETRGGKLHCATLTLTKEIRIKLGVLKLSGMWKTFNVCDLLNHHGCDRVSVTDMTEIRGGKLHWARCTHSKVIGMKPVVLKLFWMWKKSHICIWNTVRGKGGLL